MYISNLEYLIVKLIVSNPIQSFYLFLNKLIIVLDQMLEAFSYDLLSNIYIHLLRLLMITMVYIIYLFLHSYD